jgi:hypothetical protein
MNQSNPGRMPLCLLTITIGLYATLGCGQTLQEILADIQAERELAEEAMTEAVAHIRDGEFDDGADQLLLAADAFGNLADALSDPDILATLGKSAAKLQKSLGSLRDGVSNLRQLVQSQAADQTKLTKALAKLATKSGKLTKLLTKTGAGSGPVILEEVKAKSAGFHNAGASVWFQVHGLPSPRVVPCDNVAVEISNVADNAVFPSVYGDPCAGSFHVIMGTNAGAARVTVTVDGVSSSRLLYNYGGSSGSSGNGGGGNPGSGSTNSWSGGWLVTGPGLCAGVAGSWTATIIDNGSGVLSGSWNAPGWGSGSVGGTTSSFTFGGGGSGVSFTGSMSGNSASGGFSTNEDCYDGSFNYVGKAVGTFSGSKQ